MERQHKRARIQAEESKVVQAPPLFGPRTGPLTLPSQVERVARSFLPVCEDATNFGRRCKNAFRYALPLSREERKWREQEEEPLYHDCFEYCGQQCDEWLPNLLIRPPTFVVLSSPQAYFSMRAHVRQMSLIWTNLSLECCGNDVDVEVDMKLSFDPKEGVDTPASVVLKHEGRDPMDEWAVLDYLDRRNMPQFVCHYLRQPSSSEWAIQLDLDFHRGVVPEDIDDGDIQVSFPEFTNATYFQPNRSWSLTRSFFEGGPFVKWVKEPVYGSPVKLTPCEGLVQSLCTRGKTRYFD